MNITKDTRDRNVYYRSFKEYIGGLANAAFKIDADEIEKALKLFSVCVHQEGRIFVAGNGGSASISDHLECDFVKGTFNEQHDGLPVRSLLGGLALFTATANDLGYEHVFENGLRFNACNDTDLVILISSSGNSPNIINAAKYAKECKADIIGFTGFDGGLLKKMADVSFHVPTQNYGVIEDCHQAIMHYLAQTHHQRFR